MGLLFRVFVFLVAAIWGAGRLCAHDPGLSTAQIAVKAAEIEVALAFAPADAKTLHAGPEPLPLERVGGLMTVRVGGGEVRATGVETTVTGKDNVQFRARFPRAGAEGEVAVDVGALSVLPRGHRMFVRVTGPAEEKWDERLLSADERVVEAKRPGATATAETAKDATGKDVAVGVTETRSEVVVPVKRGTVIGGFFGLGVKHILTGYDHLLFLFGLLLVCARGKSVLAIVTCFTVAHSITLALAVFEIVEFPSRWVEALIAATIVFVGVENLLSRGEEPKGRWALTFSFGLIHGFGFAGVLREIGLGSAESGVAWPLLGFNLGVEAGQLAIAAVALPILWRLRRTEWFVRRGVPTLSILIAALGLYWLLERTIWS